MSRCCIYCRIGGTANEPNQIAMNSQLEMLRKAAEDLGLTVVAEVTVFESGTDPQRQSIKTLIRDGKHGAYDCVLIVDPSRLSRSADGYTLIGQKLNRHGIRVYTPPGKDPAGPRLTPSSIPDTIRKEKTILAQESKNENRKQRIREAFHDGKQGRANACPRGHGILSIPTMLSSGCSVLPSQYDVRNAGGEF